MDAARKFTWFLLRVVTGWMFFQHGAAKILGWFGGVPAEHLPLETIAVVAGWLELVGGLLVLVGFLTRPVAFLLSGQMAVAYWMAHGKDGGWPIENQGELAVLYCFIFLYMAAQGAGAWSVDAARTSGRAPGTG